MDDVHELAAGDFSEWLRQVRVAIRGDGDTKVPCGDCTACCTSSQFVHIAPEETDTLRRIPEELLFPAPRLPPGHVLMGYDEHGHCPMLVDGRCSIYPHRPRTCRTYDCRVLAAAGVYADDEKPLIAEQARRWEFDVPSPAELVDRKAIGVAAEFLDAHPEAIPPHLAPTTAAQLAVLAIQASEVFVGCDDSREPAVVDADEVAVRKQLERPA